MDDWFYWRNSRDANSNRARFLLEILSTLDVQNSLGSKNDQTIDIRFYLYYTEDFVWLRPQARPSLNREMRFSTRSILVATSLLKSCEPSADSPAFQPRTLDSMRLLRWSAGFSRRLALQWSSSLRARVLQ